MFVFSLPSSLLTLDVTVEDVAAPMEDGALPCVLNLSLRDGDPRYTTTGGYVIAWFRDGYTAHIETWERAAVRVARVGGYDAALLPFGRVYAWRSDCQYIAASALYLIDTYTPFRWDTIYPFNVDMPA